MALIPTDQRSQIMMLLVLVAAAGGYFFWTKVGSPQLDRIAAAHAEADSLQKIVEAAKADLANGTVEDLRRKVEEYSGSLELMKRLVPERTAAGDRQAWRGPCASLASPSRSPRSRARRPRSRTRRAPTRRRRRRRRCCARCSPTKVAAATRSCRCCARETCGR